MRNKFVRTVTAVLSVLIAVASAVPAGAEMNKTNHSDGFSISDSFGGISHSTGHSYGSGYSTEVSRGCNTGFSYSTGHSYSDGYSVGTISGNNAGVSHSTGHSYSSGYSTGTSCGYNTGFSYSDNGQYFLENLLGNGVNGYNPYEVKVIPAKRLTGGDKRVTVEGGRYINTYNGKVIKPPVTVYVNGNKISKKDYKVSYTKSKGVGPKHVRVRSSKYHFDINAEYCVVPKNTKFSLKCKKSGNQFIIMNKVRSLNKKVATGYQMAYTKDKSFKSGVKYSLKRNIKISKKEKGETYFVKLRTFKKVKGIKYYSNWSSEKAIKIK